MDSEEQCVMIQVTWLDHCTKSVRSIILQAYRYFYVKRITHKFVGWTIVPKSVETVGYILNEQVMFIATTQGMFTILWVMAMIITCSKER